MWRLAAGSRPLHLFQLGAHRKAQQYCTGNPDISGRKEVIGLGKDKSSPDPPPHPPPSRTENSVVKIAIFKYKFYTF